MYIGTEIKFNKEIYVHASSLGDLRSYRGLTEYIVIKRTVPRSNDCSLVRVMHSTRVLWLGLGLESIQGLLLQPSRVAC